MTLNNHKEVLWSKLIERTCLLLSIDLSKKIRYDLEQCLDLLSRWKDIDGTMGIKRWKSISDTHLRYIMTGDSSIFPLRSGGKRKFHKNFSWVRIHKNGYGYKVFVITFLCAHRVCKGPPIIDLSPISKSLTVPIRQVFNIIYLLFKHPIWGKPQKFKDKAHDWSYF